MMRKATTIEVILGAALIVLASLFTCVPNQALASPMSMFRSMASGITLHVWNTGDRPRATDLNGNFTALNNGKVGGGVQLVNSDVSNSAVIAHSKLATPALVPKAWASVQTNCDSTGNSTCTIADSSGITSITTNSTTGQYRVALSYTPANINFAALVTSTTTSSVCMALTRSTSAPHLLINCYDYAGSAAGTNQFSVLIMDS